MVHCSRGERLTRSTHAARRPPGLALSLRQAVRRSPAGLARLGMAAIVVLLLVVPPACFLIQAVSPRLFDQGKAWLTWSNVSVAFGDGIGRALLDSVAVSLGAGLLAVVCAAGLAFISERTTAPGRRLFVLALWAVLLVPSYLVAVGWEEIVLRSGLLSSMGLWSHTLQGTVLGPVGVAFVLGFKGTPFAYFALAPSMGALGGDIESSVRVHGGGRIDAIRVIVPLLLPAIMSGFVIVFAESVGDFGVATTIAASAHFPVATYTLYESISTFPANFGVAAVVGWSLIGTVALALVLQNGLMRSRSFAVVSGRSRASAPRTLSRKGNGLAVGFAAVFFGASLGVPLLGVVSSSLLIPFKGLHLSALTLSNYRGLLGVSGLSGPIRFSAEIGLVCGLATVTLGAVLARTMASSRRGIGGKVLDMALLVAVALPGVVFAAGYIFAYNLPFLAHAGIDLYGTVPLLGMAYVANAVPQSSRIMLGPFSQIHDSLLHAARVHGASWARSWRSGVLPLLARPLLWAALLAFSGLFLELPISELLAPPGVVPVSVAILSVLGKANIGQGTALSVVAVAFTLAVVGVCLGLFRLLAPPGWRHWQRPPATKEASADTSTLVTAEASGSGNVLQTDLVAVS